MRTLNHTELSEVAGGEWSVTFDLKFFEVTFSGPESIQDVGRSIGAGASTAYWVARDAAADLYEAMASLSSYELGCGGGGGR